MRYTGLILALLGAVSCSPEPRTIAGDLAFINAQVYTVDESRPWAEAVVVRDDTIIYVGDAAGTAQFIGPRTEVRDLGGKLMLPGFVEAHMHFMSSGSTAGVLELNIEQSIDEWVAAIDEKELADVIRRFGEDRDARRIARAIVRARASAPIRRRSLNV